MLMSPDILHGGSSKFIKIYEYALKPVNECEINLFLKSVVKPSCKMTQILDTTTFAYMNQRNKWLFAVSQSFNVNIVCVTEITHVQIKGTEIMTIPPGCQVHHSSTILIADSQSHF